MTQIENLLRAATRDAAAEVTPESIPRFDDARLPVPRRRLPGFARPLTPLFAAAAVVVVVVLSLVLSSVFAVPRPAPAGPGPVIPGVPPYYAALTASAPAAGPELSPAELTVRSTVTGKVLATVTPPHPYGQFILVDGTAGDRTFLVGAQVWHTPWAGASVQIPEPVRLFLLHFDPSTDRATLSALPLPQFNGLNLQTASISPDGTRITIAYQDGLKATWLHVYTLTGGAERTWTPTLAQEGPSDVGLGRDNPASIAWAANDRTISFVWGGKGSDGVHLFSTSTPEGDTLVSASKFLLATSSYLGGVPANSSEFVCDSDPFLSANGAYVLCGGYVDPARKTHPGYYPIFPTTPVTQGIGEFSATTGKLITILGALRARMLAPATEPGGFRVTVITYPYLLWASPDASTLIGEAGGHAFVVRDGHRQPIPWSASISTALGSSAPGTAW
jgi:hypothetical protein